MNWQTLMADIDRMFGWIPSWFIGLGLVAGAMMLALSFYRFAVWLLNRAFGTRLPLLSVFIERTSGPAQLALCLAAVALVLPLAPLDDTIRTPLMRLFVVAVIALIGWISIRIVDMSAARYLQNFRDVTENFIARKHVTQVRVFKRVTDTIIVVITVSTALMTFDSVRQYGVSLFASAGAAGIIVGLAARPLLSNLIAGLQIAITQPIRIEDAVIIENEWGWVEDIASTYVVIRLWDWRRMVVPLSYFIEKPFQNWTRDTASLIGVVGLHVDYRADVAHQALAGGGGEGVQALGRRRGQSPGDRRRFAHNRASRAGQRAQCAAILGPALRDQREAGGLHPRRDAGGTAARACDPDPLG